MVTNKTKAGYIKKKEANSKILKFFYFKFYSSISIICRNSLVIRQIKLTKPTATSDLRTKQSVLRLINEILHTLEHDKGFH